MKDQMQIPEYTFKIALIGSEGTGKTSLINKYVEGKFEVDYKPTLGVSILTKQFELQNPLAKTTLIIWDIAGQNKYRQMRQVYFQGSVGVFFVYDVTRERTFHEIKEIWLPDFLQYSNQNNAVRILVGNKIDLTDKLKISTKMGNELAEEIQSMEFLETSALTGDNVHRLFESLVQFLIQRDQEIQKQKSLAQLSPSSNQPTSQ